MRRRAVRLLRCPGAALFPINACGSWPYRRPPSRSHLHFLLGRNEPEALSHTIGLNRQKGTDGAQDGVRYREPRQLITRGVHAFWLANTGHQRLTAVIVFGVHGDVLKWAIDWIMLRVPGGPVLIDRYQFLDVNPSVIPGVILIAKVTLKYYRVERQ